jgi:hypothetical protein
MTPPIQSRRNCINNTEQRNKPINNNNSGYNNGNNNTRQNFIPPEAWARIPEDVRKLLYSRDTNGWEMVMLIIKRYML